MPRPERRGRGPALVLTVVAALAVVAAASTRLPPGADRVARPVRRVELDGLDSSLGLLMGLMAVGGLCLQLWLLATTKGAAPRQVAKARRSFAARCVILLVVIAAIAVWFARSNDGVNQVQPTSPDVVADTPVDAAPRESERTRVPAGPPVVVAIAALIGLTALVLSRRRARPPASLPEAFAEVVQATLDELRGESDPRRAVIAAYAAMEAAMHAAGRPRRPSESPGELLGRLLAEVQVSRAAAERLTRLFEWARFGVGAVDDDMKAEAVGALEAVRSDLRHLVAA